MRCEMINWGWFKKHSSDFLTGQTPLEVADAALKHTQILYGLKHITSETLIILSASYF